MYETAQDLIWLQSIIDDSIDNAGLFTKRSFEIPKHSLNAKQLVVYLNDNCVVAIASTTSRGEPRVAPADSIF